MQVCPHCCFDIERDAVVQDGGLLYDPLDGISVNGKHIHLTAGERIIVGALLRNEGRPVSLDAFCERLDTTSESPAILIRCMVSAIRRKLRGCGVVNTIKSVHSYGYKWVAVDTAAAVS